jgi:spermidine dehydrogenase
MGLSRRDFLEGVALGVGATVAPVGLSGCDRDGEPAAAVGAAQDAPGYYPPTRTGLRGSHPGAFEAAHALRDGKRFPAATDTGEVYDLVVVGGGISGLAAAYLYRLRRPDARVLILENHDDFGGHAKRNEFWPDGRLQLMNGGTYSIESPRPWSAVADGVLRGVGINAAELAGRIQQPDFYEAQGLRPSTFLDRETFGADSLLRHTKGTSWAQRLADAPLGAAARLDVVRIEEGRVDYLAGLGPEQKKARLAAISYADFLGHVARIGPEAMRFYQARTHGWFGIGIDAVPALDAWATGQPGFAGLALAPGAIPRMGPTAAGFADTGGSIDVHLPDGGATVARALVRALVPAALPGTGVDDLVTARAQYQLLDRAGEPVRVRLNATVIRAANVGASSAERGVRVEYVRAGRARAVRARHCVLACWNAVIPYLCPELPERQRRALHELVKTPNVYVNVVLRNWQPFVRLGTYRIHAPGAYFYDATLNEYGAIGGYRTPTAADLPTVVRLAREPCAPGLPEHEQNRIGRAELLATPFETFEREIRGQLSRMLAPGGFAHQVDILAITVNRWPHGYAPEYNPLFEPLLPEKEQPHVIGRARHGAIAIANADAGRYSYMDGAIDQAHRAVAELLSG